MALLTVQNITRSGLAPSYTATAAATPGTVLGELVEVIA
jgi:hypothetical protein